MALGRWGRWGKWSRWVFVVLWDVKGVRTLSVLKHDLGSSKILGLKCLLEFPSLLDAGGVPWAGVNVVMNRNSLRR